MTAKQYAKIRPFLPVQRGNVWIPNIVFINAVLHGLENGCRGHALQEGFEDLYRTTKPTWRIGSDATGQTAAFYRIARFGAGPQENPLKSRRKSAETAGLRSFLPNSRAESPPSMRINMLWQRTQSNKPFHSFYYQIFQKQSTVIHTRLL